MANYIYVTMRPELVSQLWDQFMSDNQQQPFNLEHWDLYYRQWVQGQQAQIADPYTNCICFKESAAAVLFKLRHG